MAATFKDQAEKFAAELLAKYPATAETPEGLRSLLAIAWLTGSMQGSADTLALVQAELAALVTE